jgi:hypothetical protein
MARRALAAALLLVACGCAWLRPRPDASNLPEWRHQAETLRELSFTEDVKARWITRAELPGVLRADAGDLLDPLVNARARDGYAAIGLLPPDIDLSDELVELTAREAAGIYSPRTRTLYVVDPETDPNSPAILGLVVVHELVHALQHQHFPAPMQGMTRLRAHDDVTTALSALLEGDASLTMFAVLSPAARSLAVAEKARPLLYSEAAKPGSELALAPRFLAISMVFPYAEGTVLAARNFEEGGNAGLDAALRDPPLSTLRVLHPEQRAPVEFVRLPLDELVARTAPSPCSVGTENTVGAHALGVLLETDTENFALDPLASEWRGDRFAQLVCGPKWELVWFTRWSTPAAAEAFAARYRALAPAIAARTPLSGLAEVVVDGRDALVVTPGLRAQAEWLHGASEVRGYGSFAEWLGGGCFPERACPSAAE